LLNKNNQTELSKISYLYEAKNLMEKFHDKRGHISSERVILEIKKHKFYWKTIRNDVQKYIKNCAQCMLNKIGISIKLLL
jgi:DNA-directed RNA polymerase delta subunit